VVRLWVRRKKKRRSLGGNDTQPELGRITKTEAKGGLKDQGEIRRVAMIESDEGEDTGGKKRHSEANSMAAFLRKV